MAVSTQPFKSEHHHAVASSNSLLVRIAAKAHAVLSTLQMARMLSTLSNMSDHQLAQIGISRSDIPEYAKTLMAKE